MFDSFKIVLHFAPTDNGTKLFKDLFVIALGKRSLSNQIFYYFPNLKVVVFTLIFNAIYIHLNFMSLKVYFNSHFSVEESCSF